MREREEPGILTAERLRRDFDASFERALEPPVPLEDFLVLALAERKIAVRLASASRVLRAGDLAGAASRVAALVGLVAIEGRVVPAYDLAVLAGSAGAASARGWALLTREPELALLFDRVESHERRPRDASGPLVVRGAAIEIVDLDALARVVADACASETSRARGESEGE